MATEATHEPSVTDEIDELERKVAELQIARAQMVAEREEHVRDAARAATVLGGLAQVHRELGILVSERAVARDSAAATLDTAAGERERIALVTESAEAAIVDLEARVAVARETYARLANECSEADRAASDAIAARDRAKAAYDETARAVADVSQKYEAALAESTIAQGRDVQYTDIEETLDREQALAETRLRDARARAETVQVEAELRRIRELEDRLASERAELERRLRAMRSSVVPSPQPMTEAMPSVSQTPPTTSIAQSVAQSVVQAVVQRASPTRPDSQQSVPLASAARSGPEPARISLATRLLRDLTPSKNA